MIDLLFWLLFGLVQGFLEWIPVSSEAFLFIIAVLYGFDPSTALIIAILMHFSTSLAALIYYRSDYSDVLKLIFGEQINSMRPKRLFYYFVVSGSTTLILGFALYYALLSVLRGVESLVKAGSLIIMILIGVLLLLTGLVMRKARSVNQNKTVSDLDVIDSLFLGVMQAFSVFPGISRSGITISSLLLRRYDQEDSVRLSFLIAPVVIIPATLFELMNSAEILYQVGLIELIIAETTAFIASLIAIEFMTTLAKKLDFSRFLIVIGLVLISLNWIALLLV